MIVLLRHLKPNPFRDFNVDPIDKGAVARLVASIQEDGFWGGVVCRRVRTSEGTEIQIAAGHHRVAAAIEAGEETADLFVAEEMDDFSLLRIYISENATQRGLATSTARAGGVAAALRLGAQVFLSWDVATIVARWPRFTPKAVETIRGQLLTDRGLGRRVVEFLLEGFPNISTRTIQDDLATLKASGDYDRIVGEVMQEVRARLLAKAQPDRAIAGALGGIAEPITVPYTTGAWEEEDAPQLPVPQSAVVPANEATLPVGPPKAAEVTFDFRGVAEHLRIADHLKTFREKVTSPGVRPFVPVERQAALAAEIVAHAKRSEPPQEVSSYFIRSCLMSLVAQLTAQERPLSPAEEREIASADWDEQYRDLARWFVTQLRSAGIHGDRLKEHLAKAPEGAVITRSASAGRTLARVRQLINELEDKV